MVWKINSTSKTIMAVVIAAFSVLFILSNIIGSLFSWFILIFGLGLFGFVLSETGLTEFLTHSPSKHITPHNIGNLFANFMVGILLLSTILTFATYQGFVLPSTVVTYLKGINIVEGVFGIILGIVYAKV